MNIVDCTEQKRRSGRPSPAEEGVRGSRAALNARHSDLEIDE